MKVELIYALPGQQHTYVLDVAPGTTIEQLIAISTVRQDNPELPLSLTVGIWGRRVPLTQVVQAGDRIELYRPLIIDPKQARQLIVQKERAKSLTLGKKPAVPDNFS